MSPRVRFAVVLSLVVAFAVPATHGLAARDKVTTPRATAALNPAQMAEGRRLYRKYCGQCHALKAALAVGFGQDKLKTDPGPSFNSLRISYTLSVSAVVLSIGGHETIQNKMTWAEIYAVSKYVAEVTKDHPILAKLTGADLTK